jgi:predicted metal-dependent enzyme (double-stranded beta helix superfamily)
VTLALPVPDVTTPRPEWLAAIATGLGAAPDLWRRRARHDPEQRTHSLLLATPVYDAWVLGWSPGQGIALHDHGGSSGAVCVVAGRLLETYATGDALSARILDAGDAVTFGRTHRHGISNVHDAPATSIHVYSPPLALMTYYDRDATRTEPVARDERAASWAR